MTATAASTSHPPPRWPTHWAQLDVRWFEEPVNPQRDPEGLADIAARVRIPVAGGEHAYGAEFFQRLVASRAVAIAMPDIKHCGGVREALRAATLVARHGGRTSLHGPSGPVSILAGAHVTAAMPAALPLEFGVYECPWRADLIDPPETNPQRPPISLHRPRPWRPPQPHCPPAPRPQLEPCAALNRVRDLDIQPFKLLQSWRQAASRGIEE